MWYSISSVKNASFSHILRMLSQLIYLLRNSSIRIFFARNFLLSSSSIIVPELTPDASASYQSKSFAFPHEYAWVIKKSKLFKRYYADYYWLCLASAEEPMPKSVLWYFPRAIDIFFQGIPEKC